MKWHHLVLPPALGAGVVVPLALVACGTESTTPNPAPTPAARAAVSDNFVNQVLNPNATTDTHVFATYRALFAIAYPNASAPELATHIRASTPRTLVQVLSARAQTAAWPPSTTHPWLVPFSVLPVAQHEAGLLWGLFLAGASDAWAVDLLTPTASALANFVTTTFWGATAQSLLATTATPPTWSAKLTQFFHLPAGAFDAWSTFAAHVRTLFSTDEQYKQLVMQLQTVTTAAAVVRVDQVLSTPPDAFSGVSEAPPVAPGGVSVFNRYRPFQVAPGAPLTIASDDLYLVPGTYRGELWTGTKTSGQKQSATEPVYRLPSSATKPGWSEWTEPVLEWHHGDSVYVLFDEDTADGITPANFTRNFFVYDNGAYDDQKGPLYQNYLATGNYINPLQIGYDNDLWIAFHNGKSIAALTQENSLPLSFEAARAKIEPRLSAQLLDALDAFYARGASQLYKPAWLKAGLFTYHQVATNAMRVVFHNAPAADVVAIKSARFILTNQLGQSPTAAITQQYATFAFGKLAGAAYDPAKYAFTLAKFD